MNRVDLDETVYQITQKNPELIELLAELGFTPLRNPAMRQTVGRVTTLRRGSALTKIPLETIVRTLKNNGYDVVDAEAETNQNLTTPAQGDDHRDA